MFKVRISKTLMLIPLSVLSLRGKRGLQGSVRECQVLALLTIRHSGSFLLENLDSGSFFT